MNAPTSPKMLTSQEEIDQLRIMFNCAYEIDELASIDRVIEAQDVADRIAAMLTKLIARTEASVQLKPP